MYVQRMGRWTEAHFQLTKAGEHIVGEVHNQTFNAVKW